MKMKVLSKNSIFTGCSEECLVDATNRLEERFYTINDIIIKQGDVEKNFSYLIMAL